MKEENTQLFPTAVVGSLPRPLYLQELLANRNKIPPAEYNTHVEAAVPFAVKMQEFAGIDIISDGEWRRLSYIGVISDLLNGFERTLKDGLWWHTVTETLLAKNPGLFATEAAFVKTHTAKKIKVAIPSPFTIGLRMWDAEKSKHAYVSRHDFMKALVPFLRDEVRSLEKVGVDIVQIDDPNLCLFVDEEYRKKFEDPEAECEMAVKLVNEIFAGSKIKTAIHMCRSSGTRNRRISRENKEGFVAEGEYDFVLPFMQKLKADCMFLEFSTLEEKSYSVLQNFKQNIGFGCVDCRPGVILTAEQIVKKVEAALQFIDKEKLILNPDCGFAPGNQAQVSIDEAYTKLKNLATAARALREKYG
ncbi:MAG: cobalamin-independent methionine synthase II family protein [Candidatus Micrarchaeota archaeon]|nr:cobalamin-independent methionine synthase II family protein [Candidatus Micrarchaeota archaeon]